MFGVGEVDDAAKPNVVTSTQPYLSPDELLKRKTRLTTIIGLLTYLLTVIF